MRQEWCDDAEAVLDLGRWITDHCQPTAKQLQLYYEAPWRYRDVLLQKLNFANASSIVDRIQAVHAARLNLIEREV